MIAGIGHNQPPGPVELELDFFTPPVFEPLLEHNRYKAAYGGRGSGKSHFFAEMLLEYCLLYRGMRIVCIREVQKDLAESVYQVIVGKIHKYGLGPLFDIRKEWIGTPGGGVIVFRGMQNHNADSIKSLEGFDIAFVEEAQHLSEKSLRLLRPTIRRQPTKEKPFDAEIWFAWNPQFADDPVDQFFRGGELHPECAIANANWNHNNYLPDVLVAEMEFDRRRDPEMAEHVWDGEYLTHSNARVFRNWKVKEFEAPEGTIFYFGADWGFSQDPSCLVRMFIVGRTIFIDYEAYAVGCEIDHTPFLFAGTNDQAVRGLNGQGYATLHPHCKEQWLGIPKCRDFEIRADSARPDTISYMKAHGFPKIVAAIKGQGSVDEGVKFLQGYDIVVHPRCVHTIDELRRYSYVVDDKTDKVTSVLADKKNHVIDSLRYALEEVRRKVVMSGDESLPI